MPYYYTLLRTAMERISPFRKFENVNIGIIVPSFDMVWRSHIGYRILFCSEWGFRTIIFGFRQNYDNSINRNCYEHYVNFKSILYLYLIIRASLVFYFISSIKFTIASSHSNVVVHSLECRPSKAVISDPGQGGSQERNLGR